MTATAGRGTVFSRDNGTTYDDIAEVVSMSGGGITTETIDTTGLNPASGFRTSIAGVKNTEEVTVVLNLDPRLTTADVNNHGLLKGDAEGSAKVNYRWTFVDGTTVTFNSCTATGFVLVDVENVSLLNYYPVPFHHAALSASVKAARKYQSSRPKSR